MTKKRKAGIIAGATAASVALAVVMYLVPAPVYKKLGAKEVGRAVLIEYQGQIVPPGSLDLKLSDNSDDQFYIVNATVWKNKDCSIAITYLDNNTEIHVPLLPGDVNIDGYVDDEDLSIVKGHIGPTTMYQNGDLNMDGIVDQKDIDIVLKYK